MCQCTNTAWKAPVFGCLGWVGWFLGVSPRDEHPGSLRERLPVFAGEQEHNSARSTTGHGCCQERNCGQNGARLIQPRSEGPPAATLSSGPLLALFKGNVQEMGRRPGGLEAVSGGGGFPKVQEPSVLQEEADRASAPPLPCRPSAGQVKRWSLPSRIDGGGLSVNRRSPLPLVLLLVSEHLREEETEASAIRTCQKAHQPLPSFWV